MKKEGKEEAAMEGKVKIDERKFEGGGGWKKAWRRDGGEGNRL